MKILILVFTIFMSVHSFAMDENLDTANTLFCAKMLAIANESIESITQNNCQDFIQKNSASIVSDSGLHGLTFVKVEIKNTIILKRRLFLKTIDDSMERMFHRADDESIFKHIQDSILLEKYNITSKSVNNDIEKYLSADNKIGHIATVYVCYIDWYHEYFLMSNPNDVSNFIKYLSDGKFFDYSIDITERDKKHLRKGKMPEKIRNQIRIDNKSFDEITKRYPPKMRRL